MLEQRYADGINACVDVLEEQARTMLAKRPTGGDAAFEAGYAHAVAFMIAGCAFVRERLVGDWAAVNARVHRGERAMSDEEVFVDAIAVVAGASAEGLIEQIRRLVPAGRLRSGMLAACAEWLDRLAAMRLAWATPRDAAVGAAQ